MYLPDSAYLQALENRIEVTDVPFSDRGSRLLLFRDRQQPSRFVIKLAERLTALQPGLSTYRQRPPYITNLHLVDAAGQPVDFALTTYPHALVMQTLIGAFTLCFQDRHTLALHVPVGTIGGLRFTLHPHLMYPDEHGGQLKSIRNCAYSTNGDIVLNRINDHNGYDVTCVIEGGADAAVILNIQPGAELSRQVLPFRQTLRAAEERWDSWFRRPPAVDASYRGQYYYAWWVLGNNILAPQGHFKRECVVPSKAHYIGAWQWDNYFHALALRYSDPGLAADQLYFMLDHQLPDGMIPDAIYDEGAITHLEVPVAAAVTKPPIMAWIALHLFERTGDLDLLRSIYEPLVRLNSWWFGMNDDDADGIVQYRHPFSSGLDDSPLWDGGMPVEAVDINTYLCLQMEHLARIATLIGRERDAAMWELKRRALAKRMVEHFYDQARGLFWSSYQHQPIPVLTPFSLYPLWTGLLPPEINQRLVQHLTDPAQFWTAFPLPTVAIGDPTFNANQMWRGPVWINVNYIFIEALRRTGFRATALQLAERTMALVQGQNDIYEYYHPLTGQAPPKAAPMFGWSAACYIDLAIQLSQGAFERP